MHALTCIHIKVGDNQSLLQSLKDSPYYQGLIDKVSLWETRLVDLDEYLHQLNQIQRKWVYLEPIFGRGLYLGNMLVSKELMMNSGLPTYIYVSTICSLSFYVNNFHILLW